MYTQQDTCVVDITHRQIGQGEYRREEENADNDFCFLLNTEIGKWKKKGWKRIRENAFSYLIN